MIYLIVPVKNESETIHETSDRMISFCRENFGEYRIVFIDDGSTDGTHRILSDNIPKATCAVYKNKIGPGKGSALKFAFLLSEATMGAGADDLIVFMDGDGQIHPKEIKTLLKIMHLYDADVIIGNKRHQYSNIYYSFPRKIVSLCYNLMIRILFGLNMRDTQCGLKIFRKSALDKVIDKVSIKKYAFDLELLVALKENNFRIVDAPVAVNKQMNSGSVNIKNIIITFIDTITICIKKNMGNYR